MTVLTLVFPAMIGILVGQSIKELQHCHFSWLLPGLRRRLFFGALIIGVLVVFTRDILVFLAFVLGLLRDVPLRHIADFWDAFPPISLGLASLAFLAFWIGVRPTALRSVGVMGPLVLFVPFIESTVLAHPFLTAVATAPVIAFLMYDAFRAESARERPFLATMSLTYGGVRAGRRKAAAVPQLGGTPWHVAYLGDRVANWLRAGWYENYGYLPPVAGIAAVASAAVAIGWVGWQVLELWWTSPGASIWNLYYGVTRRPGPPPSTLVMVALTSTAVGLGLAAPIACYSSISLTPRRAYPLSRRRLARVESWAGGAECLVLCGLVAAALIAFWTAIIAAGPGLPLSRLGGSSLWLPILLRPLAAVLILLPIAQFFRLRYIRGPVRWSVIRQRLSVAGLVLCLVYLGTSIVSFSYLVLPVVSVSTDIFLLGAIVLVSHGLYRRAVDRYFAIADLA